AGKGVAPRRELRALRRRLGPIPPGQPDGEALAEALGEYLETRIVPPGAPREPLASANDLGR
ncbi:MAG TPA: hypothetical protein VKM72_23120, partial [Thermoanaerobaculia bacterium]|nr:hypothetical protein [Thermoanaerobaculia bacterium]